MGLKAFCAWAGATPMISVKIRPRWDWKDTSIWIWLGAEARLKSDQDGIERKRMFLKSSLNMRCVKIRPRWDWKLWPPYTKTLSPNPVKIRPRWDWKMIINGVFIFFFTSLKSDQDGIESSNLSSALFALSKLKSDQDGIESTSPFL